MLDEDKKIIRLYCSKCDNVDCFLANVLGYVYEDSKKGCSRIVDEEDAEKYYHYTQELIPFWIIKKNEKLINDEYKEIMDFLESKIYTADFTNIYKHNGKVLASKDEIIKNIIKEF